MNFLRLVKISSAILIFFLIFVSCQDDPTSIGKDFIGGELQIIELNSITDSLAQSSGYYIADSLSFGASPTVLLGNLDYVKSTLLLRFGAIIPDSIQNFLDEGSLTVLSAQVTLYPTYKIGDKSQQLSFTVHEITSEWGTTGFNKDSLSLVTYEPNEITDSKQITDSAITFNVNNNTALNWLESMGGDTLKNNYGMILFPTPGTNVLYGFRGFTNVLYDDSALLQYIVQNSENKIDTINTRVLFDVHVPEGNVPQLNDERITLIAGLGQRGKLYFDVSKLPEHVNINKAELTLYVDSLSSVIGSPDADSLRVHLFADSTQNLIDDDEAIARIRFNGDYFEGTITRLIQAIASGKENQGFSLTISNEIEAVDKYVIYGSNYPELSLRPKLVIYYNEFN